MNATERKELKRAKTLLLAGDRTGALGVLRALETTPQRDLIAANSQQLVLAFVTFRCERLKVEDVPVHVCVTRQKVTDIQRTQQTNRGQGTDYPLCDTRTCQVGRAIRAALGPNATVTWKGAGAGWLARFTRERDGDTDAARERLERVGLLHEVPTVDGCPEPVESQGEEGRA